MLHALAARESPLPTDSIVEGPERLGEGGLIFPASGQRLGTFLGRSVLPPRPFFILCPDRSADKEPKLCTVLVGVSVSGFRPRVPAEQGAGFVLPGFPFASLWPPTEMEQTGKDIKAKPLLKSRKRYC